MIKKSLFFLICLLIFIQIQTSQIGIDYQRQYLWPGVCRNGIRQTPIDIDLTKTVLCPNNLGMIFNQTDSKIWNRNFKNQDLKNPFDNQTFISFTENGVTKIFNSYAYHWHAPSQHWIDGKQLPLELHIVHISAKKDGMLAVASILFELDQSNQFQTVFDIVNFVQGQGQDVKFPFEFAEKSYFHYKGSLTTPPCTEAVDWFILTEPYKISSFQLKKLIASKNYGRPNNRLPQRLFTRKIYVLSQNCPK